MGDKIKSIIASAMEVPLDSVSEYSSQDNTDNWDSLHHMSLVVALEKEFNIIIPDDDVPNMVNFKLIKFIINEQV